MNNAVLTDTPKHYVLFSCIARGALESSPEFGASDQAFWTFSDGWVSGRFILE